MSVWRPELIERLASLGLKPEREAEIVEELAQHLDDRVDELIALGAEPTAAREAALRDLDAPGELARRLAEFVPRPLRTCRRQAHLPVAGGWRRGGRTPAMLSDRLADRRRSRWP